MFKKRRRPTPHFKIPPPYNPIAGEQANLRQEGTAPFCAMMQVAEEDTYDDYVICRGFDTRILKFIDYEDGNDDKPGISVAKPFGKRKTGTYQIGEVYPALLPTQGNSGFSDFRQVSFTPPSPTEVNWRVGQNPGSVSGGGLEGGQPEDLDDTIEILYDHNEKVVNWLLIDGGGVDGTKVTFQIDGSASDASGSGELGSYKSASCSVLSASCGQYHLVGNAITVHDVVGCYFNEDNADLDGRKGHAELRVKGYSGDPTDCFWECVGLCCPPDEGQSYAELSL